MAEWVSTDGVRWTRAPDSPLIRAVGARSIVGSATGFAVVGDADPAVLMSGPDGGPWRRTQMPVPAGAAVSIERVRPTDRGFLAVGTLDGRSALWRWENASWSRLRLLDTDGITDARNRGMEDYGEDQLLAFASTLARNLTARELLDSIAQDLSRFTQGAEQADDITLVALKVL